MAYLEASGYVQPDRCKIRNEAASHAEAQRLQCRRRWYFGPAHRRCPQTEVSTLSLRLCYTPDKAAIKWSS